MKVDFYTGEYTNIRAWLADLCDTLPAVYEIEYVRVWQLPGQHATTCDPASHPTREWIAAHPEDYRFEDMRVPLLPVRPGGAPCESSSECNPPHGECQPYDSENAGAGVFGVCSCLSKEWTGPRCLSQSGGDSRLCWEFEHEAIRTERAFRRRGLATSGLLSSARLFLGIETLNGCAAPDSEDEGELALHWEALCEARGAGVLASSACAVTNVSDAAMNDTRARCTSFARLSYVLDAAFDDSGGAECCNGFGRLPGDLRPIMSCTYGPSALTSLLLTLTLVVVVPLLGVLLARCSVREGHGVCLRGRCQACWNLIRDAHLIASLFRRKAFRGAMQLGQGVAGNAEAEAATEWGQHGGQANNPEGPVNEHGRSGNRGDTNKESAEEEARALTRHAELGASLLMQLTPEAKASRRALLRRLACAIGAQMSNADNQAEHLESLLFSHLGRCDGDVTQAVDAMHHSLLGAQQRWRLHTSHGGERGAVGSKRLDAWTKRHAEEQVEEAALYLLIWGEAGNLRFMP